MAKYPPRGNRVFPCGSTLKLSETVHDNKIGQLDTAAGCTVTLWDSTGRGGIVRFYISTVATTNSHIIKVNNTTDVMVGTVLTQSDDAGNPTKQYFAGSTDDTITLNRSTTGSTVKGEYIEIQDTAAGVFVVRGFTASTGTEATPFSSTV